jgi:fumarate hydratase class II
MTFRSEQDTMGEVKVPQSAYYGAQTARSLQNFEIGIEKIPREVVAAFGVLKKAAALVNRELGLLSEDKAKLMVQAAETDGAGRRRSR